jgi:hypothetical protein
MEPFKSNDFNADNSGRNYAESPVFRQQGNPVFGLVAPVVERILMLIPVDKS